MGGTLLSQVPQLTWFTRESGNLTRVEVTNNYDHQDLKRERREEREKERNDIGKRGDWSSKSSRWLVRNVIVIIIVASKRNFTCGHAMWKSDHDCYRRDMQIWHVARKSLLENCYPCLFLFVCGFPKNRCIIETYKIYTYALSSWELSSVFYFVCVFVIVIAITKW